MKIRDLEILDLRFPTSRTADGTDAMHPDPDYSAAYVILKTDGDLEDMASVHDRPRQRVCVERFAPSVPWWRPDARGHHR